MGMRGNLAERRIAAVESIPPVVEAHTSYVREIVREVAPTPAMLPAAHHMVRALIDAGVDTFFGVPGGPVMPVFDAVMEAEGAHLVESRHESAAGFAAVGYYRASGRVPAIVVTAGPGVTNAISGIISAHLEHTPMIIICGDVAWSVGGRRLLQDTGPDGIAIEQMLSKVTRAQIRVAQPRSAASQAMAAYRAATDPHRPGPALLVVPIHQSAADAPSTRIEAAPVTRTARPPRRVVDEAARMLAKAQRPLIVVGAGCRPHAASIRRLVDALDVPFMTTPQAKGIVSEEHPRSLRHGGLAASWWARNYTAAGVDCALVLGTDLDDCSTGPTPPVKPGGKLIHVDLDGSVFNRNHETTIGVLADVGAFADSMYDVVIGKGLRHGGGAELVREARTQSAFENEAFASDDAQQITPHRAIADLERAAGDGATFVTDIGEHMLFALHYLTARGPNAFNIHLGLGSMGSGICSAVGLAVGRPSSRVVCICGDGGMQMAGMEALVAIKERLPIVYAVFNDARYNMVHHGYKQQFGREGSFDSPWVDFVGWGRALGMRGARIEHPGEITSELLDSLTAGSMPAVLDIRVDSSIRMRGAGRVESLQHMSMPVPSK
jgi:acetolactate synthase-1/2/3 large subunit